jgi:peptidoglycan/xylan/chitin deacetylase (PgdA/CDA1 family)
MRSQLIGVLTCSLLLPLVFPAAPAAARSSVVYQGKGTCRDIALTYDVEFSNTTADLLNTIDDLGIRTTWFFLGDKVDRYPELVRRVAARHEIGNHTLNHLELPGQSAARIRQELQVAQEKITAISGRSPLPIWRPPYGEYNGTVLDIADEKGYPITVLWSIDTRDWDGPSVETIRRRIVQGAFPGAISLQHGFPPNTVAATRLAVGDLRERGYQFLTVTEILGIDRDLRDFGGDTYVVQAGDSFDRVGRCHNITGLRLAAYNEVDDLAPGDHFRIPHVDELIVRIGGERQEFAVYPRLRDSHAMVHIRVAERLGAEVDWDGTAAVLSAGPTRIAVVPGQQVAQVNGAPADMGAAAYEEDGRILVPLRFLAEHLGWQVSWDGDTYSVNIARPS